MCIYEYAWPCVYKSVKLETISCVIFRTTPVLFSGRISHGPGTQCLDPGIHLFLPDHCWLIAHVTMPGILIWALELKLRSPCSQRKHFIGCTTPTP